MCTRVRGAKREQRNRGSAEDNFRARKSKMVTVH